MQKEDLFMINRVVQDLLLEEKDKLFIVARSLH